MTEFCRCGLALDKWLWGDTWIRRCPKHKEDYLPKEERELIGRHSGKSKRGIKGRPELY